VLRNYNSALNVFTSGVIVLQIVHEQYGTIINRQIWKKRITQVYDDHTSKQQPKRNCVTTESGGGGDLCALTVRQSEHQPLQPWIYDRYKPPSKMPNLLDTYNTYIEETSSCRLIM
jgi:hypothetical protein